MTQAFLAAARQILGEAAVKTEDSDVSSYAIDWRKQFRGRPLAVMLPTRPSDLSELVRLAQLHQVALVPQGGNTGLAGGATPDASGRQVIVSLVRMNQVRALDPENKTLTVEAGVTLLRAQELADEMGLLFPLSLGAEGSATIGGNLSTNAGGTAVLRYGNARELCLGIEVVTAQGDIWDGLRGLRKDNTGYDLKDLFIGSEGTLGFITAAVLKLYPKPKGVMTALIQVDQAAHALSLLQIAQDRCDAALTGFEYMSAESLALLAQHFPETARPAQQLSGASLVLMEVSHPLSEAAAVAMLEEVIEAAQAEGLLKNALLAESMAQAKAFWHMRESIPLAASEDGPHVKHDIAVPVSALNQFIGAMDAELLSAYPGIRIINFGHFGDGNLHYNLAPPPCPGDAAARRLAYQAFIDAHETDLHRRVHDRVVAMRGSISAEHGLGQLRRDEAARYKSPVERQLMQQIKTALDPKGIMNPGKML